MERVISELGRPKFGDVGRRASILLLKVLGFNELKDLLTVAAAVDAHLLLGEVIHELVGHHPEGSEHDANFDAEEPEEPSRVVLLHGLDHLLDVLVRHLGGANGPKVEDGRPVLYLPRHHGLADHVVQEEVGRAHQQVDLIRHLQNLLAVHNYDRSVLQVSLMGIDDTLGEHVLDGVVLERVGRLLPLGVSDDFLDGHLVLPLFALEHPKHEPVLIIVPLGNVLPLLLAEFPERFKMVLLLVPQLDIGEYHPLVLARLQSEELVVHGRLKGLDLFAKVVDFFQLGLGRHSIVLT
eukprot:CAMPEP_0168628230 /NCGR_PEP_ID=MMETSP0449_2-20121227/11731_1 /TAXON_ID=1082188 /ORGANISM="Strombidium rassoulzadegani, Strain ras09" /LENGTH=293 /DNA_ID=CAMNT_0008670631 /DNA_START=22 /DNA_END=900 /DNA_ORIENTATION=+